MMRETVRTTAPYLWRYRTRFALGLGSLVLKDLAAVTQPLFVRSGVDSLTAGFRIDTVLWFAAGLAGISAIKGIFQYWMRVILIGASRDIEYDLRNDFFAKLVTLSQDFYGRTRTGDIMARATNDLNAVRMMLGPGIMYWTETMLTFVLALGVMLSVDWPLTLIALSPAPLVSVAVVLFGRGIHDRFEKIQAMFSDISSRVQENIAGVRVVRAFAQEKAEQSKFEKLNLAFVRQNLRLVLLQGTFMPMLQSLIGITFLIVLLAGGYRLLQGKITLGVFMMFNVYMGMLIWPMIAFGWVVNLMQRGTASMARINQILREQPSVHAPEKPVSLTPPVRGEIEFDDVAVEFPSGRALNGATLRIPAGATVAIVGHTGSGKSTLVHLIPRILDPTSGRVRFDGIDVRDLDPAELRRQIAFVPQETFLFSATLAENIAFGLAQASDGEILRAAEIAGLGPDLASFPDGLKTMVGERGITLSGGQKQRTAIARAVLRNPRVLVLDDALSSVDTITEEQILTRLSSVMEDRTTILISHRVSTVRKAGRIFVLEHGQVVEEGSHESLLANGGYYADLYQKQLLEEELTQIDD